MGQGDASSAPSTLCHLCAPFVRAWRLCHGLGDAWACLVRLWACVALVGLVRPQRSGASMGGSEERLEGDGVGSGLPGCVCPRIRLRGRWSQVNAVWYADPEYIEYYLEVDRRGVECEPCSAAHTVTDVE